MADLRLKVCTLNCWGLPPFPISGPHRTLRLKSISQRLAQCDYDIVSLQEIWMEADYNMIRDEVAATLPYSFYFHSGYLGSGVCVFSRVPIKDTLMHRFSLNGYAHHVHRGDWFGGKVVGLCVLKFDPYIVYAYATHVHAEYNREQDLYLPHRVVQAYELSQFVKLTSHNADLVVCMGDFNLEPEDLGYKMILANGKLFDAWTSQLQSVEAKEKEGYTCNHADNSFKGESDLPKRIDYIVYRAGHRRAVTVDRCHTDMHRIEGHPSISYSDHEAVVAEMKVQTVNDKDTVDARFSVSEIDVVLPEQCLLDVVTESLAVVEGGIKRVTRDRRLFLVVLGVLLAIFLFTLDTEMHYNSSYLVLLIILARFALSVVIGFVVWYGLVMLTMEAKAFKAAQCGMNLLLNRLRTCESHDSGVQEDHGDLLIA